MELTIVRHGETNYNLKGLSNSIPTKKVYLTPKGKKQAEDLKKRLPYSIFDAVYVSELYRTHQTARLLIDKNYLYLQEDARLNDRRTGFEDEPYQHFIAALKNKDNFWTHKFNDGESFEEEKQRIFNFLNDLRRQYHINVLIIAHAETIKLMHGYFNPQLSNTDIYKIPVANCALFQFKLAEAPKENLSRQFYLNKTPQVAKYLLGKILVNTKNETAGMIVETEAYVGEKDAACHTHRNSPSGRTCVMYQPGGLAYVYQIYGLHYCLNVVTNESGDGEAVLIRALEPLRGIAIMIKNRTEKRRPKNLTITQLTSGPAKLCQALDISRKHYGSSFITGPLKILHHRFVAEKQLVVTQRVGIDYAGGARDYPYRFYWKNNPFISQP